MLNVKSVTITIAEYFISTTLNSFQEHPRNALKGRLLKLASIVALSSVFGMIFVGVSLFLSLQGNKSNRAKRCVPYTLVLAQGGTGMLVTVIISCVRNRWTVQDGEWNGRSKVLRPPVLRPPTPTHSRRVFHHILMYELNFYILLLFCTYFLYPVI